MKKRVFLLGLLFLVGLSVLLYPLISSEWNRHRSDAMIDSYTQTVSQAPAEDRSAWIDSARQYNAALGGKHFPDAFANITREESAAYLAQLAFDDNGVMAYISIPRIDNTPLFGGSLADFYIYLKNGEVHRINCYTTTGKYGFRFAYVDIDGKSYFTDYWYFMAMLEFVEPYYRYTRYGEK